jgi:hypothetical protein
MFLTEVGGTTQSRLGFVVVKRMEITPLPHKLHIGSVALVVDGIMLVAPSISSSEPRRRTP